MSEYEDRLKKHLTSSFESKGYPELPFAEWPEHIDAALSGSQVRHFEYNPAKIAAALPEAIMAAKKVPNAMSAVELAGYEAKLRKANSEFSGAIIGEEVSTDFGQRREFLEGQKITQRGDDAKGLLGNLIIADELNMATGNFSFEPEAAVAAKLKLCQEHKPSVEGLIASVEQKTAGLKSTVGTQDQAPKEAVKEASPEVGGGDD